MINISCRHQPENSKALRSSGRYLEVIQLIAILEPLLDIARYYDCSDVVLALVPTDSNVSAGSMVIRLVPSGPRNLRSIMVTFGAACAEMYDYRRPARIMKLNSTGIRKTCRLISSGGFVVERGSCQINGRK